MHGYACASTRARTRGRTLEHTWARTVDALQVILPRPTLLRTWSFSQDLTTPETTLLRPTLLRPNLGQNGSGPGASPRTPACPSTRPSRVGSISGAGRAPIEMCIDMQIAMCTDMYTDVCMDNCVGMHMGISGAGCAPLAR